MECLSSDVLSHMALTFLRPEDALMLSVVSKHMWQHIRPLVPRITKTNDAPTVGCTVYFSAYDIMWRGRVIGRTKHFEIVEFRKCEFRRKRHKLYRSRVFPDAIAVKGIFFFGDRAAVACPECRSLHTHPWGSGLRTPRCNAFPCGYYVVCDGA